LPDAILQQIRAADDEHLERWAERILVARTTDDVSPRETYSATVWATRSRIGNGPRRAQQQC